jgi:hypothetical protein
MNRAMTVERTTKMKERRFTIILAGVTEMTDEIATALYEAGCDDATPGSCDGVAHVAFDREAPSLEDAIRSAAADISKAGYSPLRIQIDQEDLQDLIAVTS